MKHPATREFFSYWDEKRAGEPAPDRSDLDPEQMRHLLADIFVLSYDAPTGYPFRVAGTRVCALLGSDVKGQSFTQLFDNESRREIEDIISIVAEEALATVAGVTAQTPAGTRVHFELLLLPFSARSHTPLSLTGMLAPLGHTESMPAFGVLKDFSLTSWRHVHPEKHGPRALRKWSIVRGLTVYEGLR